jgi:hypothetical protein
MSNATQHIQNVKAAVKALQPPPAPVHPWRLWPAPPSPVIYDDLTEVIADYDDPTTLPEIPPEVHNTRPINPSVCMAAIRAMCGEGR